MSTPQSAAADEAQRLEALRALGVLDTAAEPVFEAITALAARACGVPIALISLIDADRQWFKSNRGLPGVAETHRSVAFCDHAIRNEHLLEVNDATLDGRFAQNPLVTGDPHIRFYAGMPIVMPGGERIGTVCVIDREPRQLDPLQQGLLEELGRLAATYLLERSQALQLREAVASHESRYRAIVDEQAELVSLADLDGTLTLVNPAYARHFGAEAAQMIGRNLLDFVEAPDRTAVKAHLERVCTTRSTATGVNRHRNAAGEIRWVAWSNRAVLDSRGKACSIQSVGRDITEQRLAEEALAASEMRYRRLYEATPALLFSIDPGGRVLSVSDRWLQLLDYERSEVIGRSSLDFLAPESRRRAVEHVLPQFFATGRVDNIEYQFVRKDGGLVDVLLSSTLERDSDSAPVRSLAVLQDVTEKKALAAELGRTHTHLDTVLNNLPALVSYLDHEQRFQFTNKAYEDWFGTPSAQLIGKTLLEFYGPEVQRGIEPHFRAAFAGELVSYERAVTGAGPRNYVQVTMVPHRDEQGVVVGVYTLIHDITARRAAEQRSAASERFIRNITDNLPAMISHFDRDLRYTFANARVGEVFGCEAASLSGRLLRDVRGEAVYQDIEPAMARALAGESVSIEVSSIDAHGRPEHFEANYVPEIDASGQVLGFYALTFEVTERKKAQERLRASEQLLDRTGSIAGVGGWEFDLTTNVIHWTSQTRRIHEVDDDYVPSVANAIKFYAEDGRPAIERALAQAMESGTPWDLVLPFVTALGRPIWVRATGEVEIENGKPVRMLGAFQDVSQRVAYEHQLHEQAELLQITLKSIGDGVITTDERGRVRWMNPAAERMTGWTSAAAAGRASAQVFHVVHADTRLPAPDPVDLCLRTLGIAGLPARSVLISSDGTEVAVEDAASPIHDENGRLRGAVLVFHDVTEQRRMSDQMTHRATHDELTGLVNRAEFESRVARVLSNSRHDAKVSSLMFIDLDQFKLVNDACGHAMGDKLLCQVSELMSQCVRNRDTLARLGGDEFGVLLEHCNVEQAQRVAQGICDRMEEFRFIHDGRKFRIGTSIGLVPIDARWSSQASLQQAADTACYAAKEAGRNRVHVWFDTDLALRNREGETQWGSRLESALDEDNFVLFAQRIDPVLTAPSGLHFEVLLRLREGDGTIVAPGQFLPAAERFHMASRIDQWVLREVFRWMAGDGGSADIDTISINLSGQSIGDRAFHRFVVQLLDELPIDPTKVCFEVTETAAITNLADATSFIQAMRKLGMRVALDDFGAGASSFGYLKNLPVDYLKIDGQFIRNMPGNPLDMAAVRCFHDVARAIGVKTVAEFVETEAVMQMVREIGIDFAQGYLLHRPEPLEALVARARKQRLTAGMPVADP